MYWIAEVLKSARFFSHWAHDVLGRVRSSNQDAHLWNSSGKWSWLSWGQGVMNKTLQLVFKVVFPDYNHHNHQGPVRKNVMRLILVACLVSWLCVPNPNPNQLWQAEKLKSWQDNNMSGCLNDKMTWSLKSETLPHSNLLSFSRLQILFHLSGTL